MGWLHLNNGQLLAVRTRGRDRFYLPGGKIEPAETLEEALIREVREELGAAISHPRLAFTVEQPAHGQRVPTRLTMHCFHAVLRFGSLEPDGEIAEIAWLDDPEDPRAAPAVQEVLHRVAHVVNRGR